MDIATPLRELGPVDSAALRDIVLAQEDGAWKEDVYRQEAFEVHHSTESIVMLFVDIERWPDIVVKREPGWPRLAETALPLMNDIISRFYPPGGTVIRAMAAKLVAGGKITPHVDRPYLNQPTRPLHDRWPPLPVQSRRSLRDQQPENPLRHEQRHRRPHYLHLRLRPPRRNRSTKPENIHRIETNHPLGLWLMRTAAALR